MPRCPKNPLRIFIPALAIALVAWPSTPVQAQSFVLYESGTLGNTGIESTDTVILSNLWRGASFTTTEDHRVTTIGAHFGGEGTFLIGIFRTYPEIVGDPLPESPKDPGLAYFMRLVEGPGPSAEVRVTPSEPFDLPAGDWAIVVGAGVGTSDGTGFLPRTDTDVGNPVYLFAVENWQVSSTGNARFFVEAEASGPPRCGDAMLQGSEQCDDGNVSNRDGCLNSCREATCGDRFVQRGIEECDDGNHRDDDGCTNACALTKPSDPQAKQEGSGSGGCDARPVRTHGPLNPIAWLLAPLLMLTRRRIRPAN